MRLADEGFDRDSEEIEGLELNVGELRWEGLDELLVAEQGVPLGQTEEAQDLFGGRALAEALFGVDRIRPKICVWCREPICDIVTSGSPEAA